MRSWGPGRVCGRWLLVVAALGLAAASLAPVPRAAAPEDELPEGEGKKILVSACTSCHELNEVTKFSGYYTRSQWRDIVVTMKEYGAPIETAQVDVLADYLDRHFGRK